MIIRQTKAGLFAIAGAALLATACGAKVDEGADEDLDLASLAHGKARASGHGGGIGEAGDVGDACAVAGPSLPGFAIYAKTSASLGSGAHVAGGDVGVQKAGAARMCWKTNLDIAPFASVATDQDVYADSVSLRPRSSIGAAWTNHLKDRGGDHGEVSPFPPMPALPTPGLASPGDEGLRVGDRRTVILEENARRADVRVRDRGTLRLRGGVYHFRTLEMGSGSRLEILAASEVRVLFGVDVGKGAFMGPADGVALGAADLVLSTNAGWDARDGEDGGVRIGPSARVRALVLAPNAQIRVKPGAEVRGTLMGARVALDAHAKVIFEGGLGDASSCSPDACDDGNPCTVDTCCGNECRSTNAAAGTSCGDGDVCNGDEVCDGAGACIAGTPMLVDDGNPCTADSCDPAGGVMHTPVADGTSCANADACDGAEMCMAGTCVAGAALVVDDGNPCTADSCDATAGVSHTPMPAGTACGVDLVCDEAAQCVSAVPVDQPPTVVLAPTQEPVYAPATVFLTGMVSDDVEVLQVQWSVVSGPGLVFFSDPTATTTQADFFTPGVYVLRLTAWDGMNSSYADTTLEVLELTF